MATFEDKGGFERYWYGEEFSLCRADYSSWYQVPILYIWNDLLRARRDRRAGGPHQRVAK